MTKNRNLREAKTAKNDEFYTSYSDVSKEMKALIERDPGFFTNRTVLCPCNDLEHPGFRDFFIDNFQTLGIRRLTCTSYVPGHCGHAETVTLNRGGYLNVARWALDGDGDFRSPEITKFMQHSDLVVTNPPFSCFREFVDWADGAGKDFYIIGNKNCVNYNEVFRKMRSGRIQLGITSPDEFETTEGNTKKVTGLCRWYTTMSVPRKEGERGIYLKATYDPAKYSKFENFDAINIDRVSDIPKDYYGVMGVPITFFDHFDPKQFEVLGRSGDTAWVFNECKFFTPPPEERQKAYKAYYKNWRVQNSYLLNENGMPKCIYYRVFIRRK